MIDDVFHNINCAMIPTETMPWSGNSPPQANFFSFSSRNIFGNTLFSMVASIPKVHILAKIPIFPGGLLNSGLLADLESAPKRAGGSAEHKLESLPPNRKAGENSVFFYL